MQGDVTRVLNSTTPLVHQTHFYENFGDIDFWRKPSVSQPPIYEVPVIWNNLPRQVSEKSGGGCSTPNSDVSHQCMMSHAAVDTDHRSQDSSHPIRPRKRSISVTLPLPPRKIDSSTDGGVVYCYADAEGQSGQMSNSWERERKENGVTNPCTLLLAGAMYESSYIMMHSAHCTSCPSLPHLEDGLYVAMDGAESQQHYDTRTVTRYYNVPAKIAGIPATYFMPGPMYNLPSSRPVHPL